MLAFVFFGCKNIRYDPNQKYEPISDQRLTAENETATKEAEEVQSRGVFLFFEKSSLDIHPGRLTWNIQITHLERKLIFQTPMIMFHVNLPGCCPEHKNFLAILLMDEILHQLVGRLSHYLPDV